MFTLLGIVKANGVCDNNNEVYYCSMQYNCSLNIRLKAIYVVMNLDAFY